MTHPWLLRTYLWLRKSFTLTSPKCAMALVFKSMQTMLTVTLETGASTRKLVKVTWHTKTALNTEGRWLTASTMVLAITFGLNKRQLVMKSPKIRLDTSTSAVGRTAWCTEMGVFNIETVLYSSRCLAKTWPYCQAANTSQTLSWVRNNKKTLWTAFRDDSLMRRRRKSPNATKQTYTESMVLKSLVRLWMKSE